MSAVLKKIYNWLENYWYHNKWQTLIAAFFIFVGTVIIGQMITKDNFDVVVLYGGPHQFTPNETRQIQNALQSVMSEDFNGDGEKNLQLVSILLMTQEQIDAEKKSAAASGAVVVYNSANLIQNRSQFSSQVIAGETVICLIDPNWYTDLYKNAGFIKLSEGLGYTPDNVIDEYSMYFADTDIADYFSALQLFPADTILCVRRKSTASFFSSAEKERIYYENQLQMFRDMMSFKVD